MDIDVTPSATRTEISGVNGWRGTLQVRVAAAPEHGKANEELVRFLSEVLAVDRDEVAVVKGARSHRKRVFAPLSPEEADKRLGRCR